MRVRTLFNRIPQFERATAEQVRLGLRDAAYDIERGAASRAPVKTGNLRNSLASDSGENQARVYSNVEYAGVIEDRVHYLDEAFNAVAPNLTDYIRRHAK